MGHVSVSDLVNLMVLALPVASISWAVTHEELFHELREYCVQRCQKTQNVFVCKLFYLPTCEYCFSHYVAAVMLVITRFKLLYPDWRGYLISGFALVWVANHYMSLYGRVKLGIRSERLDINLKEAVNKSAGVGTKDELPARPRKAG